MRRTFLLIVLLAGAAIALEPVIHTHPLAQSSSATPCAVCVNAHTGAASLVAAAITPLALLGDVFVTRQAAVPAPWRAARTSRGPPAV